MTVLRQVNLSLSLTETQYVDQLARTQALVGALAREAVLQQRPIVAVFEGWDAAGKGGCIKRFTEALDPRSYIVYAMGQATAVADSSHHYLYPYWQRIPERGRMALFDGSWYGRVLGDRVAGRCSETEWKRAYRELNQFERQLVDAGIILFKFWLHITREEQLHRLELRAAMPEQSWKLTPEDWRSHELWDVYEPAVEEMLLKTSTIVAPWTIVEALDRRWARIRVLRTVADTLARELRYDPNTADALLKKAIRKRPRMDPRISQGLESADLTPASPDDVEGAPKKKRK